MIIGYVIVEIATGSLFVLPGTTGMATLYPTEGACRTALSALDERDFDCAPVHSSNPRKV